MGSQGNDSTLSCAGRKVKDAYVHVSGLPTTACSTTVEGRASPQCGWSALQPQRLPTIGGKYSRHPRSPSRDQRATACNRGKYCQSPSPCLYGERGRCRRGCGQRAVRCRREWTVNHGTLPHITSLEILLPSSIVITAGRYRCAGSQGLSGDGDQQAHAPSLHSKRSMSSGSRRR